MGRKNFVNHPLLGTGFVILAFFSAGWAFGSEVEELRKSIEVKSEEIKRLEAEAKKFRDEIVSKQRSGKTLQEELLRIDRTIRQLRQEVAVTEKKIDKTALEISELDAEIGLKEESLGRMQRGLAWLVEKAWEHDKDRFFAFLMAPSMSEFLNRFEYSTFVQGKILEKLDFLRQLKHELEIKRAQADTKRDELEGLGVLLVDKKKIQEGVRSGRNSLLVATKNQEKQYQSLLRETEKKQEAVMREIEELEEELRKQVDPSSLPGERKGFLARPVDGGVLSQGYGETPFSQSLALGRGSFFRFHNGIDIAASLGTPIFAADRGRVLAVGDSDRYCPGGAYGKYIVIDHANNLTTLYAHLSLIKVTGGQEVARGAIIGYMGSSGLSTGSHLHFTLYDSRTVEVRKGPTGACGLLPYGGSLNPQLYL